MEIDRAVQTLTVPVSHASDAGEVRRQATALAEAIGLEEVDRGRVALVATELGTNLAKHAGGSGRILLRGLRTEGSGVELLSIDSGPGFDVGASLRDGLSTSGTRGVGLGAVQRTSDTFDLWSAPGRGSVLVSRVLARPPPVQPAGIEVALGAICVPFTREPVAGDRWATQRAGGRLRVIVVDGLGHGAPAAVAARTAVQAFEAGARSPLKELLESVHQALRVTRGAAVAIAELDGYGAQLRFAGLGNVSATLIQEKRSGLASVNGTAGAEPRAVKVFEYPLAPGALLILHSDGIGTRWSLDATPELRSKHPSLVCGLLYRDHARPRDDATVLAVRYQGVA
ncbi:MAG TPA: ATP-binding SpoIIE family protein phosphatase [Myxococcaceae bacterium]|nr:ATP-binding SpoIIE family protein phosphatase [Myxococcaceae bacterium]